MNLNIFKIDNESGGIKVIKLIVRIDNILDSEPEYMLINSALAHKYDILPGQLIEISPFNIGLKVYTSDKYPENTVGISGKLAKEHGIQKGNEIVLKELTSENLIHLIHKKMKGDVLQEEEIDAIFESIDKNLMHPTQIAVLMSLFQVQGLTLEETTSVAKAIINNSQILNIKKKPVVDKHSIGGIAGNRITPIMVPILAASGLTIPKVSTRAITSPAGTIDAVELLMPCELTLEEMTEVVDTTGGCIVSGETVGLADVSDKIIAVLEKVKIDPKEFMVASIIAKKIAAGSEYVLIDLPTGKGAKVVHRENAQQVGSLFISLAYALKIKLDCIISPGDRPIGSMIGPALEAKDALQILTDQSGSADLMRKALSLSGIILEAHNLCPRGYGFEYAEDILRSGKALQKFKEIVVAQGGDENIEVNDIPQASYIGTIEAKSDGVVYAIDSAPISTIARQAGAPADKTAGVVLKVKRGDRFKKGDVLFEIHSSTESKLTSAVKLATSDFEPIDMEKMILDIIRGPKEL
ncbi:MAG: thymidine phosphorylase [Candidatus Heimdallarchaeota archaeon]|nr:thymidine phosphorylase [Candidatus Heimdallarchaeota archaeon]MCK4611614.1 thymidine phosphorylase [Candidatus Heimdallarchaeota archaeon]